ncbi:Signal transduction histidine kinase [Pannonibacter phragmitetus]|uniref:Signal transduction histidine kinase n=1 Tax=Pannonibacter phragmitetus TaxID=121719 RepID=A0A378ZTA0_9HYPH|nr:cache domain-containing protein [Pannonibacter phragmitetus]SUB00233.1 Signal transduction histidine kinase [Pannonibacter phragmitetus]
MLKISRIAVAVISSALAMGAAFAEERASADDAMKLLDKAEAHFKTAGAEQAYADFSSKDKGWQDRDLYVFCFDKDGVALAHGANEKLIGKNLSELKDADGNLFIGAMVKTGLSGGGWTDYRWANPVSKKIEPKSSYAKPFADGICGVGIYK